MGVVVDVRLVSVLSLNVFVGCVPMFEHGMVVVVRVRRDKMLHFAARTAAAVMCDMYVVVVVHEVLVLVRLETRGCHFAPPSHATRVRPLF